MKVILQKEINLYLEGYSTYQIAEKLNQKPNTIRVNLRNHGLIRKNNGLKIENMIEKWFRDRNYKVDKQKGDFFYDLLVNNEKIDVKSAHPVKFINRYKNKVYFYEAWKFELIHKENKLKDISKIDNFILVFLGMDKIPFFSISSRDINKQHSISISNPYKTKHNLRLIGYLEERR